MPLQSVTGCASLARDLTTRPEGSSGAELSALRKVRARAPLRLGLAGGGTDVAPYCDEFGGLVINATIDRYCYATVEQRCDGRVAFVAADGSQSSELGTPSEGRLPLHEAVYARLNSDFDLGDPALTVTSAVDAPPGSGLGSSSTLVVALIEAMRAYFSLPLDDYELAQLAVQVEREDCGLLGGRQDQYAATFGGFNLMEFGAHGTVLVVPLRLKPAIVQELEASLVLVHTGVGRDSAGIIEQQAAFVRSRSRAQLEATHALRREASTLKDALVVGDLSAVASVLNSGWRAKKELADGISTPRIEAAFETALRAGALGGKISGAGGGGYILFLVEPMLRPQVVRALNELPGARVEPVHFVSEGAVAWALRQSTATSHSLEIR